MPILTENQRIAKLVHDCKGDYVRFNHVILNGGELWKAQREICRSVRDYHTTLAVAGNAVGKSHVAARVILGFMCMHPNAKVVCTAPTQTQLAKVLWKAVDNAYTRSRIPLGGRMFKSPLTIDMGGGWEILAYSTTKVERFSGIHAEHLLAIKDESSGIVPEIHEAFDSLSPSRVLELGNPLRPDGGFYERCHNAAKGDDPLTNLIRISSLDSPHKDMERSPWGLADATWLAKARRDYGEGSIWWKSHVLAQFPDSADDTLIPRDWLDLAARTTHQPGGSRRIAIDLGGGGGGDRSVVLVRDDNGILDIWHSNVASMEAVAQQAKTYADKYNVTPNRVTYDRGGIGADFDNRLRAAGINGASAYMGGTHPTPRYANLRTAAAWLMRQRLDPGRTKTVTPMSKPIAPPIYTAPDMSPKQATASDRVQFAIRPDHMKMLREELQGLKYELSGKDQVALEKKEKLKAVLRRSPDFADALIMSFAYPGV